MSGRTLLTLTMTGALSGCSGWLAVPWTCSTAADCQQWCTEPGSSFEGACTGGYCVSSALTACIGPADAGSDAGWRVDAGAHVDAGPGADAGPLMDAGSDGGAPVDAGADAGPNTDAGFDAGFDAGTDAGLDAGFDAGQSTSWEQVASGTTDTLFGVVAFEDGEAWVAGAGSTGLILQYSPSTASWTAPALGFTAPALYGISGFTSGGVTQLWAVGPNGGFLEFDGSRWASATPFGSDDEWGVWAVSSTEAWAVGTTTNSTASVWHLAGGTWTSEVAGLDSAEIVFDAWAAGPSVVWAAAESQSGGPLLANWSPATSSWSTTNAGLGGQIPSGVGGTSADDVWVATVASGALSHWNGEAWTVYGIPNNTLMTSVWAASPSDAWAVGDSGTILHWDGSAWQPETTTTTEQLNGVSGNSTTVWAVGMGGTILRRGR